MQAPVVASAMIPPEPPCDLHETAINCPVFTESLFHPAAASWPGDPISNAHSSGAPAGFHHHDVNQEWGLTHSNSFTVPVRVMVLLLSNMAKE